MKTVSELKIENLKALMKEGPGLRYSTNVWIVARDLKNKMILLGGLGAFGIGEMWVSEELKHKDYPGYASAMIVEEKGSSGE